MNKQERGKLYLVKPDLTMTGIQAVKEICQLSANLVSNSDTVLYLIIELHAVRLVKAYHSRPFMNPLGTKPYFKFNKQLNSSSCLGQVKLVGHK